MNRKRKLLKSSRLYVILDRQTCGKGIFAIASKIKNSGADLIQYRDKSYNKKVSLKIAQRLKTLLEKSRSLFIVNDHVDIARAVGADGVHLGQDDFPVKEARKILGKDKIIGLSCQNLAQGKKAQKEGADYIGAGPVFNTLTKPSCKLVSKKLFSQLKTAIKIPVFAIGGINQDNLNKITPLGVHRVAVCRQVCLAKHPKDAMKAIRKLLL